MEANTVLVSRSSFYMFRAILLSAAILPGVLGAQHQTNEQSGTSHTPLSWLADCAINDIQFLSPTTGWAVGDHGLVLFTRDGGHRWHRIPLDTRCSFRSMHFVDANHGWIVGGFSIPYMDHSRGIIWRTTDGGRNWTLLKHHALPSIQEIRFESSTNGWCIALGNSVNSSGLYTTNDGGLTWSHRVSSSRQQWIAADQVGAQMVMIGDRARVGFARGAKVESGLFADGQSHQLSAIQMLDEDTGYAVGSNGSIVRTRDGGLSWFPHDPDFDPEQRTIFDFRTLCIRGPRMWIAGNPGTVIFQFDLTTKTWYRFPTGINQPIRKIEFWDQNNGWLVTSQGTILATRDGGRNWHAQRQSSDRVGLMVIAESPDLIPIQTISRYCGEDRWITSVLITNDQPASFAKSSWQSQIIAHQSVARLGASHLQAIHGPTSKTSNKPTPSPPDLLINHRLAKLVREIRAQRPSVIIIGSEPSLKQTPMELLIKKAVEMAASPNAFESQIHKANLREWQVDKIFSATQPGGENASITHRQYLTRIGMSVEDHCAISCGLLNLPINGTSATYLKQIYAFRPTGFRESSVFNPEVVQQNGQAQRQNANRANGSSATHVLVGRKSRSMTKLRQWDPQDNTSVAAWSLELDQVIKGLEAQMAGIWLYQLADHYLRDGKIDLAARTLAKLVNSNSNHPFCDASMLWLTNYFNSAELALLQVKQLEKILNRPATIIDPSVRPASLSSEPIRLSNSHGSVMVWTPPSHALDKDMDPRSQLAPELNPNTSLGERMQRVYAIRQKQGRKVHRALANRSPDLPEVPAIKFSSIVSKRKNEGPTAASFFAKGLSEGHWDRDGFARAALVEQWLNNPQQPIGRIPILDCAIAKQRPRLDGILDDLVWTQLRQEKLVQSIESHRNWNSAKASSPRTQFAMAYDREFLYFALRCEKATDLKYAPTLSSRSHDQSNARFDRINIRLDVDRDYVTSFSMTVDSRGAVSDSCAHNPGWNPKWYVATRQSENEWIVEAAIPLEEIVADIDQTEEPWALSAKRIIPNTDSQLWPLASLDHDQISIERRGLPIKGCLRPKEFGLLRFEEAPGNQSTENEKK